MNCRHAAVVLAVAVLLSGCALGDPKPTTYVSDTGATLNGDVYSSVVGDTEFWWRYGETTAYGTETPHRTLAIADDQPHPVSEPISGLNPNTTYHLQLCVQDQEEDPPRAVCSSDRTFTTGPAGGRSGIAFMTVRDADNEIYVMDADGGNETRLTNEPGLDVSPSWSPDGRKIVFSSSRDGDGHPDLWVMDSDGGNQTRLTDTTAFDQDPAWSPDGTKIAYYGSNNIEVVDADGGNHDFLTTAAGDDSSPDWSPDGRRIAFMASRDGNAEIYVMNADGSNQVNVTDNAAQDTSPSWSPDGQSITFFSDRDGNYEIYSMDADGGNQLRLTEHSNWDRLPAWSHYGDKIAFGSLRDGNEKIFVMNPDGSEPVALTNSPADTEPAWSPRP